MPLTLKHPMDKVNIKKGASYEIILTFTPVAACWRIDSLETLRSFCTDILKTLKTVHGLGFVHRDIRADNILLGSGFLVIDWELAAPIGSEVFWEVPSGRHPAGVTIGSQWLPWMDLWQLGKVIEGLTGDMRSHAWVTSFKTKLLNHGFESAHDALEGLTHGAQSELR